MTERASVEAAVALTVARFGKLDVLHNNAGGSTMRDGPVTEAPEDEFWRVIRLDLYGTFLCSKLAIPEIIRAGGGSVINMSSNVALMALPGRDCYTAAKGGIAAMTRSMAVEYAPHKIRVNAIAPSVTLTERVKRLLAQSPEIERLGQSHLLGFGQPIHIADMAVYLAVGRIGDHHRPGPLRRQRRHHCLSAATKVPACPFAGHFFPQLCRVSLARPAPTAAFALRGAPSARDLAAGVRPAGQAAVRDGAR